MSFNMKSWSNPITLDSNNLNRIEQGIKNAHDTLEITNEEVSNLQNKQAQIVKELNTLTKDTPNILDTLNKVTQLLNNNDISAVLSSADNFLMKTSQTLTSTEIDQVYKNLKLNSFLKLTSIKVNGESVVSGSEVNIALPNIDTTININSNNAISNSAVAKALKNINLSGEIPDELADLKQDTEHQTVSLAEKIKWNSFSSSGNTTEFTETDPTVPAWAKKPNKPLYEYSEIINTPVIPTNTNQLDNGAGYITISDAETNTTGLLEEFKTLNIIPINNRLTSMDTSINNMAVLIANKSDKTHTHDYADSNHNHDSRYTLIGHTHDEYKTYTDTAISNLVGSAPDTLNTLKELADAITANKNIVDALDSTYLKKSGGTTTGTLYIGSNTKLINLGTASDNPIITRGIVGATTEGAVSDLYLQAGNDYKTFFGKTYNSSLNSDGTITEAGTLLSDKYAPKSHTHSYSAVYTGASSTQSSNTTLSTLRIGFASSNLYIWNS